MTHTQAQAQVTSALSSTHTCALDCCTYSSSSYSGAGAKSLAPSLLRGKLDKISSFPRFSASARSRCRLSLCFPPPLPSARRIHTSLADSGSSVSSLEIVIGRDTILHSFRNVISSCESASIVTHKCLIPLMPPLAPPSLFLDLMTAGAFSVSLSLSISLVVQFLFFVLDDHITDASSLLSSRMCTRTSSSPLSVCLWVSLLLSLSLLLFTSSLPAECFLLISSSSCLVSISRDSIGVDVSETSVSLALSLSTHFSLSLSLRLQQQHRSQPSSLCLWTRMDPQMESCPASSSSVAALFLHTHTLHARGGGKCSAFAHVHPCWAPRLWGERERRPLKQQRLRRRVVASSSSSRLVQWMEKSPKKGLSENAHTLTLSQCMRPAKKIFVGNHATSSILLFHMPWSSIVVHSVLQTLCRIPL